MANDIEITVSVRNTGGSDFNRLNQQIRNLRQRSAASSTALNALANKADQAKAKLGLLQAQIVSVNAALRTLRGRAAAAAEAMDELAQHTREAGNAMRSLNTRTRSVGRALLIMGENAQQADDDLDNLGRRLDDLAGSMRRSRDEGQGLNRVLRSASTAATAAGAAAAGAGAAVGGGAGGGGGGLGGAFAGLAAAIGGSALPALGAFVPMAAGMATASTVMKMSLSGVSEAVEQAGKDQKKYNELLKKMSPAQRAFTKQIVAAKEKYDDFSKTIQKITLPGFSKGLKAAGPAFATFKTGAKGMARVLRDLAADAGKTIGSPAFRNVLKTNMQMGTTFVDKFARSLGRFGVSLLEFGAASRPTFNALTNGISGMLGKGLPGMFDGLKRGIGGSASMFRGLFDSLNLVLPAFGRFAGQLADTFGPAIGSAFRLLGRLGSAIMDGLRPALEAVSPLFHAAATQMDAVGGPLSTLIRGFGSFLGGALKVAVIPLKNLVDLVGIAAPFISRLGGALSSMIPSFDGLNGKMGWIDRFSNFVKSNKLGLQNIFSQAASGAMSFAEAVVGAMPKAMTAFRMLATVALRSVGTIITGLATAFGNIPGIGPKLVKAAQGFGAFARGAEKGMSKAQNAIDAFSKSAGSRMKVQHLRMDISNWQSQLKTAKEQLKDPNLTATRKAKISARIDELEAMIKRGKEKLATMKGRQVTLSASDKTARGVENANKRIFTLKGKTAQLKAADKTLGGRRKAQTSIFSLRGVTRNLLAANKTTTGRRKAQSSIFSLKGVSRNLIAKDRTAGGVTSARRRMATLANRVVSVTLKTVMGAWKGGKRAHGGIIGGMAHGGNVGARPGFAANGGARSNMTWVGEQGPELLQLPVGSRVRTNADARAIANSRGGGDGPIVLELASAGSRLDDLLLEVLRKSIRVRGGNVQLVLGGRA